MGHDRLLSYLVVPKVMHVCVDTWYFGRGVMPLTTVICVCLFEYGYRPLP